MFFRKRRKCSKLFVLQYKTWFWAPRNALWTQSVTAAPQDFRPFQVRRFVRGLWAWAAADSMCDAGRYWRHLATLGDIWQSKIEKVSNGGQHISKFNWIEVRILYDGSVSTVTIQHVLCLAAESGLVSHSLPWRRIHMSYPLLRNHS